MTRAGVSGGWGWGVKSRASVRNASVESVGCARTHRAFLKSLITSRNASYT